MKYKELTIKKEIKFSKNYSSINPSVIATVELEEGDNIDEVYKEVSEKLHKYLIQELNTQMKILG